MKVAGIDFPKVLFQSNTSIDDLGMKMGYRAQWEFNCFLEWEISVGNKTWFNYKMIDFNHDEYI